MGDPIRGGTAFYDCRGRTFESLISTNVELTTALSQFDYAISIKYKCEKKQGSVCYEQIIYMKKLLFYDPRGFVNGMLKYFSVVTLM